MSDQELLDVFDENNKPTGQVLDRGEVHRLGLWHRTAHIFFVNSKNEILLQQRSQQVKQNPGMWDVSVAGHITSRMSPIITALKEIWEELGISVDKDDLNLLTIIKHVSPKKRKNHNNKEFQFVFICYKEINTAKLSLGQEEVEKVKYFTKPEVLRMFSEGKAVRSDEKYILLFERLGV